MGTQKEDYRMNVARKSNERKEHYYDRGTLEEWEIQEYFLEWVKGMKKGGE